MFGLLIRDKPFQTFAVKELHPTFGAEITGVDFENTSDEQLEEIRAAMAKYAVCVFRATGLTDARHVAFAAKLGAPLDNTRRYMTAGRKPRYAFPELFDAGNLDDNDAVYPPTAFNPRRAGLSILRAAGTGSSTVLSWPREAGGNTEFADSRAAWDDLPQAMQDELLARDYTGVHCIAHSRKLGSPDFFRELDPRATPMARHKIVQRHEQSGRMNLYVGAHCHHLEDAEGRMVEAGESWELIQRLNAHIGQDKYVFGVVWEQVGDVIAWDNRAVLHRAGKWTGDGKYRRDLRRTTAHDEGPTAWGVNPVGEAQPSWLAWTGKDGGVPGEEGRRSEVQQQQQQQPAAVTV
ncbi:alpha-ketoglutarate-dependent 2,4-dichlorophenoxyacetate dioxygenase [Bombardia bombarda]|uniref:Alpha-ketoglutarate-dependent 2,4-dichlorophenoxyacetate dioxygenase n=1 Tax=Bombardia bombarda TaxID=252184 RepID=A0AA39XK23_9PEZI|nr:alpha-ketoglutarate-dependent 2,4-dichlorophenoxyacetate dioxygenase [Bombardia bombarda]